MPRRILMRKSPEVSTFQLNTEVPTLINSEVLTASVPINCFSKMLQIYFVHVLWQGTQDFYSFAFYRMRQEVSLEEMLQAARKEIERLKQELDKKNNISQFRLGRFMYDDEMIRFFTGFSSSDVLRSFIDVIKPSAEKIKTWSQVQRGRAKKPGEGIINEAFVNMKKQSLAIEDQLFMWLCKVKLGLFDQDLAVRFNVVEQ
ncbi:hypothetical protein ACROYT_G014743 [Oculina patagonica]